MRYGGMLVSLNARLSRSKSVNIYVKLKDYVWFGVGKGRKGGS